MLDYDRPEPVNPDSIETCIDTRLIIDLNKVQVNSASDKYQIKPDPDGILCTIENVEAFKDSNGNDVVKADIVAKDGRGAGLLRQFVTHHIKRTQDISRGCLKTMYKSAGSSLDHREPDNAKELEGRTVLAFFRESTIIRNDEEITTTYASRFKSPKHANNTQE